MILQNKFSSLPGGKKWIEIYEMFSIRKWEKWVITSSKSCKSLIQSKIYRSRCLWPFSAIWAHKNWTTREASRVRGERLSTAASCSLNDLRIAWIVYSRSQAMPSCAGSSTANQFYLHSYIYRNSISSRWTRAYGRCPSRTQSPVAIGCVVWKSAISERTPPNYLRWTRSPFSVICQAS